MVYFIDFCLCHNYGAHHWIKRQKAKLLKSETGIPAESKKLELPQSDPFEDEIRRMKAAGQKQNAIKLVVETLGYDFATAIDYVENLD